MKQKTNRLIQNVNICELQQWCGHGITPPIVPADEIGALILSALEEQNNLGWDNFIKGRCSKLWGAAQDAHL
eukprot:4891208-Ditylum_brightwellii.AAC.1